jgi:RNA polymerase sigma-70 factor (ECF subfamily)
VTEKKLVTLASPERRSVTVDGNGAPETGRTGPAFERTYAELRAPLYSFLVRLSGRADIAEDLLQEMWLRFARHAHELDDPRPWLFTVARNLYRSYRRWAVLDADRLRELGLWPRAAVEGPFERLCASEGERALERALAALPIRERELVLLCGPGGVEPAQAAAIVGISSEAFRQRLARARGKLRELLHESETHGARHP